MTIANAFALYFCIGTIYAASIIYRMKIVSKYVEEIPIENDEDHKAREELIRSWETVVMMVKTPQNAVVALFILITFFWPYVAYTEIRMDLRRAKDK